MITIPKKVSARLIDGLKRFKPILDSAKGRDINESDTSIIVIDLLGEVFGYDKYSEITREYEIRGTYCDLAIKLNGKLTLLIEVKSIGTELQSKHIKQAVDYAQGTGLEWVALTNGVEWKIYHIIYGKPVEAELIIDINIQALTPRHSASADTLFLLSKEGFEKNVLSQFKEQKKALSRHVIAAILQRDDVTKIVRREIRKLSPNVKTDLHEIKEILRKDVIKRDAIEGEEAIEAEKALKKLTRLQNKKKTEKEIPPEISPIP